MERTKNGASQKPLWKKITRGTLYPFPKQRKIKVEPGETIEATEEELGKYRDQFELVRDGVGEFKVKPVPLAQPPKGVEKETYRIEETEKGLYEVIAASGKVMNDHDLTFKKAEELKASLEKETVEA